MPRPYCARMAREKAGAVPADDGDIVLAADTTVAMGRRILGKPADAGEAAQFLHALSGRRHRVLTAVAVRCGARLWQRDVVSIVKMKRLSDEEINAYLAGGEWQGKAGGYGIQGMAGALHPVDFGLLHRHRRPAARRDGGAVAGGGVSGMGGRA